MQGIQVSEKELSPLEARCKVDSIILHSTNGFSHIILTIRIKLMLLIVRLVMTASKTVFKYNYNDITFGAKCKSCLSIDGIKNYGWEPIWCRLYSEYCESRGHSFIDPHCSEPSVMLAKTVFKYNYNEFVDERSIQRLR